MASFLKKLAPFLVMLGLLVASIVVSCATLSPAGNAVRISMNTGAGADGRVHTAEVFDRIDAVVAIDPADHSRRTALRPGDWRYDSATTEIMLERPCPFRNPVFHVEGWSTGPRRFMLGHGIDDEDLLVIVGDRLAIEGFDYTWNPAAGLLSFRRDLDLAQEKYLISFRTRDGGMSSLGDLDPGSDRTAYLQARHQAAQWKRLVASGSSFPFLEKVPGGGTPHVVMRPLTPEERGAWASLPVEVLKFRHGVSDRALGAETGFDVRLPRQVVLPSETARFADDRIIVERMSVDGTVVRRLCASCRFPSGGGDGSGSAAFDADLLEVTISASPFPPPDDRELPFRTGVSTVDLGAAVERISCWGIRTGEAAGAEAVLMDTWRWSVNGVYFEVTDDEAHRERDEAVIRGIIAWRKR